MQKKRFLITGVSSGIGFQISSDLLLEGHSVLGVSRRLTNKVKQLQMNYPEHFIFESLDIVKAIDALPKWVLYKSKELGKFDGFVHSAGIQQILPLQINTYTYMREMFDLNVFSGLAFAKGIVDKRVMNEQGGSIVFISSIASKQGQAGLVNYSASKAALNGAARSMAKELASRKIRVNSVLPGFVMTEMIEKLQGVYSIDYIEKMNQSYPLGIGEPKDVSNMVCFLLDQKAKWITGCEFDINGGATLGK